MLRPAAGCLCHSRGAAPCSKQRCHRGRGEVLLGTGCPQACPAPSGWDGGLGQLSPLALLGPLPRRRQHTGLCSLSADQPDAELPVPQQALASISHEHCLHHPSVLPILPGCSRLPLLHHLVVSTRWTTAWGTEPLAAWQRRGTRGDRASPALYGTQSAVCPAQGCAVLPQAGRCSSWSVPTCPSCS